jgi:ADP-heptose:LPS heptosyltransferase
MSHNEIEKSLFQKRRKMKHWGSVPWYKKLGLRLEEYNKRLTLGLIGKLLGTNNVSEPLDLKTINRVLILRYDAIGDMVVTTPFWRILKQQAPHITIGVACSLRNRAVLSNDPDVDEIYDFSVADTKHILKSLQKTRDKKWDLCLQTVYLKKTKGAIVARLAAPGSSTSIVAHDKIERYKKLFSIVAESPHFQPDGRKTHMLEHLKAQFGSVFDYKPSEEEWHPSLVIDEAKLAAISERVTELHRKLGTSRFVLLNTEAQTSFKEWGYTNALSLAQDMEKKYSDCALLLIASPNTSAALEDFLRTNEHPNRMVYFPTGGIQEVMALVRHADLVISPDTSVIHIATAERKPTIAVYLRPNEWVPYQVPYRVVSPAIEAPVSTVSVDQVLEAMNELLPSNIPVS